MTFAIAGCAAVIDGAEGKFSCHLAAFEACMRIREPAWKPIGGGTYFTPIDAEKFELLRATHARLNPCP